MQTRAFRLLVVFTAASVIALSGCSGKSLNRALTLPGSSDPGAISYNPNYSAYPYSPYLAQPGYTNPLVTYPSDARIASNNAGSLLDNQLADLSGAFANNFATLHLQLPFGVTSVSPLRYLFASPNTFVSRGAGVPPVTGQRPAPLSENLLSARDNVSFLTYGLYAPNANQHVISVDIWGQASFGAGVEHGLYVGVRQFGEPRYSWYGPFSANERWHVDARRDSSYPAGTAAYVTLAVFNGDNIRVDSLDLNMGS